MHVYIYVHLYMYSLGAPQPLKKKIAGQSFRKYYLKVCGLATWSHFSRVEGEQQTCEASMPLGSTYVMSASGRRHRARGGEVLSEEPMSRGAITTLYPENLLPVSMLNVLSLTLRKMLSPFSMKTLMLNAFFTPLWDSANVKPSHYSKLSFIHLLSYHSFIHSFIKSKIMYRGSHLGPYSSWRFRKTPSSWACIKVLG